MGSLSAPVFLENKERFSFFAFLLICFFVNIAYEYYHFLELKAQKTPIVNASVLLQYTKTKESQSYFVLKLQSDFGVFYTTSKEDLISLQNRKIKLNIIFDKVNFWEYLKGFYAPSFNLVLLRERDFRESLRQFIAKQHTMPIMGEYYLTLFLSDSLPLEWRKLAQSYGISHLFAISGYHTGILSAASFFLLALLYVPLQRNYFPYRNRYFDLGFLVLLGLVGYYFLLTQSPSYLRALVMSGVAFFLLVRGLDILRLESFFWCVGILLAFFPRLIFSVGFYFSCLGVLYIFLFLKYFKIPTKRLFKVFYALALNVFVFFAMGIVVYYFFPYFSPFSLYSLILTPLFGLYYPLVVFAHLIGFGGFLDSLLLAWLNIPYATITLQPNLFLFLFCNILTLFALFFRWAFILLFGCNLIYYGYGIYLYSVSL